MKKVHYFILASFFYLGTKAQTVPAGENISLDEQLTLVNKSSVTSGIIYERVKPMSNLYEFNQNGSTHNTANYPFFEQALSELYF